MSPFFRSLAMSIFLASIAVLLFWLHQRDAPKPVADSSTTEIACLSYAPYRQPDQSPFKNEGKVSKEQINEDLTLLRKMTSCIRTYAATTGLEAVLPIAQQLDMTVLQGVWIGRDHEENLTHLDAAIALVNQYPKVAKGLIVGNEVLLRREQPAERIIQYLKRAQSGTQIPVTYADVWEFWETNKELAPYVDFLTIHILPFWEDEPVAVEHSVGHVFRIYDKVARDFSGQNIFIGETGWPSVGRMRGPAKPGIVEQARFVREFLNQARQHGLTDYNLIEAFDQPWKRHLEGAMGAGWGLLDYNGRAKFSLTGPVAQSTSGLRNALMAGALFAGIGLGLLILNGQRQPVPLILGAAGGFLAGAILPTQMEYLLTWNRSVTEWIAGLLVTTCSLALAMRVGWLQVATPVCGLARTNHQSELIWRVARFVLLFALAVMLLLHAFDARYRGFPTALYLPGVIALVVARLQGSGCANGTCQEENALAVLALLLVAPLLWGELPANTQSIGFAFLAVAAALSCWPSFDPRTMTSKQVTKATAPSSGT